MSNGDGESLYDVDYLRLSLQLQLHLKPTKYPRPTVEDIKKETEREAEYEDLRDATEGEWCVIRYLRSLRL